MHFALTPEARTVGHALLVVPLRLERAAAGQSITIPGQFISCQQILDTGPIRPHVGGSQRADMNLRFQLPAVALPMQVERMRLMARIEAPARRVVIAGQAENKLTELHRVDSPLDPIRVEISDTRFLGLDERGGLHLNLSISDELTTGAGQKDARAVDEKWKIEDLEVEVVGKMKTDG